MNNTKYVERMVNNVDRILVDTSTLMHPGFCQFVNNNRELLLEEGKRIIVPKSVYTELARHLQSEDEKKVYCAMDAIALLKNNEDIFQVSKSMLTDEEISRDPNEPGSDYQGMDDALTGEDTFVEAPLPDDKDVLPAEGDIFSQASDDFPEKFI